MELVYAVPAGTCVKARALVRVHVAAVPVRPVSGVSASDPREDEIVQLSRRRPIFRFVIVPLEVPIPHRGLLRRGRLRNSGRGSAVNELMHILDHVPPGGIH